MQTRTRGFWDSGPQGTTVGGWRCRGRKTQYASMHCIPESFCASGKFLRVYTKLTLKSSQLSGKFPDSLESFRTVWKDSDKSRKFPDSLERFWIVWKVSNKSGKFPDSLESFRIVWKVSGQSGKFPDSLEYDTVKRCCRGSYEVFLALLTHYVAKAIYALLAHFCREKIYALRPESFCA